MIIRTAYKLLTKRKDGTLGPLFINRRQRIPIGKLVKAEDHPTKGYKHRWGWHTMETPHAPHLSDKGRVWCEVLIGDYETLERPTSQGGVWFLAKEMVVLGEL